jgi:hypothetical protein
LCLYLCIHLSFGTVFQFGEKYTTFVFSKLAYFINIMISSSIHLPEDDISFFFMAKLYSTVYIYHIFLVHQL